MDRLVVEKEAEIETKTDLQFETQNKTNVQTQTQSNHEIKNQVFQELPATETQSKTQYLNSLENITIADFKKQEDEKVFAEFEKEKEILIAQQYEKIEQKEEKQEVSQNIIEKPNYDLIEENKKIVKIKQKTYSKKKSNKKLASIAIACALGVSSVIAITNCVIIENMSANYMQIDETYKLNLAKYLKNINNLDQAQNSMEFLETYPEDLLDAGDTGEKSNWFDRFCNFIGGIFGG